MTQILKKKKRIAYYVSLPIELVERWETVRANKGLEKSFMVTNAFEDWLSKESKPGVLSNCNTTPSQSAVRE